MFMFRFLPFLFRYKLGKEDSQVILQGRSEMVREGGRTLPVFVASLSWPWKVLLRSILRSDQEGFGCVDHRARLLESSPALCYRWGLVHTCQSFESRVVCIVVHPQRLHIVIVPAWSLVGWVFLQLAVGITALCTLISNVVFACHHFHVMPRHEKGRA